MVIEASRTQESAIQELGGRIGNWIERQFEEGKLGGIKVADLLKWGLLGATLANLIFQIQTPKDSLKDSEVGNLLDWYGKEGGQAKMVVMLERKWAPTIVAKQKRHKTEEPGHLHGLKEIAVLIGPESSKTEKKEGAFDRALIKLRVTPFEKLPRLVVAVVTKQDKPVISRPATREELEIFASLLQKNPPLEEI